MIDIMNRFVRCCSDGYQQGWHERNGGNLSYRMKKEEVEALQPEMRTDHPWVDLGCEIEKLGGYYFLVTASGKYFRNVELYPKESMGVIEVSQDGRSYRPCWGFENGSRPTSELPSHLLNHAVKLDSEGGRHRVIYHAHTTNVIAMTFVLPLDSLIFTRELWEMATECPVVFPKGVGVVEWMVPGQIEIAYKTSELMKKHDLVIWAHHGMFASGSDFDETFGLMHTAEKAAEIWVKVRSISDHKHQTISAAKFRALADAFSVELPEVFLYEK